MKLFLQSCSLTVLLGFLRAQHKTILTLGLTFKTMIHSKKRHDDNHSLTRGRTCTHLSFSAHIPFSCEFGHYATSKHSRRPYGILILAYKTVLSWCLLNSADSLGAATRSNRSAPCERENLQHEPDNDTSNIIPKSLFCSESHREAPRTIDSEFPSAKHDPRAPSSPAQ